MRKVRFEWQLSATVQLRVHNQKRRRRVSHSMYRVSQQRSDNVNNRTVLQTKVEDIQSLQGYQGLVRAISNYHKSRRVTPPLRVVSSQL